MQLSNEEAFLSEVYAVKMLVICLMKMSFDKVLDRNASASALLDLASNTIEHFIIKGADASRTERVHAAMQERVQQMISSALNPKNLQRGR